MLFHAFDEFRQRGESDALDALSDSRLEQICSLSHERNFGLVAAFEGAGRHDKRHGGPRRIIRTFNQLQAPELLVGTAGTPGIINLWLTK